ncbi:PepSY-associated TM helix domain-containing protein [Novosphingobium organovorum]|uniref:PepSY-associated TM helix domain-containing protein n=1 Tax=Novosphingobium organovorum TaxID=2930092 RepID=UPI0022845B4A|nr:PepSY-associated TM helix domain-containing protein [Novosphingobium organovorum]
MDTVLDKGEARLIGRKDAAEAAVAERGGETPGVGTARRARCAKGGAPRPAPGAKRPRKARAFWLKQLHTWHWISAAVSLAGMALFALTGITLNHAASIGAQPVVTQASGRLSEADRARLSEESARVAADSVAPLPGDVARAVGAVTAAVHLDPAGHAADWSDPEEIYVAMPGPGRDAWVSIDRQTGAIAAERTERGWISYLNDLHKGRNTGTAWAWFIDLFAGACVIFTLTGFFLLHLHARHRPSTWPLVAASFVVPLVLALFFIH